MTDDEAAVRRFLLAFGDVLVVRQCLRCGRGGHGQWIALYRMRNGGPEAGAVGSTPAVAVNDLFSLHCREEVQWQPRS